MGKIWIEIGLVSARGLKRPSLLKLQWFAVGWIDPKNKYCTKIDPSGNANPIWKTKFATLVNVSNSEFQDLALHVEVYSREPIFLRERLQGTATIVLREFLAKHAKNSDVTRATTIEEMGSYQLRKGNSSKPQGFVDISVRISEEGAESHNHTGNGGLMLMDRGNHITVTHEDTLAQAFPTRLPIVRQSRENHPQTNAPENHSTPIEGNYHNPSVAGPSNYPIRTTPPPPSNVGFIPTFLPRTENLPGSHMNMSPSGAEGGQGRGQGFGMGLGAGALAAGAAIFGEDFMSGFDVPRGLQDASLTVSMDPPFLMKQHIFH
ncbi:protein SRC2 homolog isoform X2 [Rhodamnia argentea]|nr:protein SRC2 homolog isoform X2 [Rhodamnia argentea]